MRGLWFPHRQAVQLLAPSLCHGWSVLDLVVHVRMGLQELAIGTTSRTDQATDHDAASYWRGHPDGRDDDPVPHILWLRRVASAYRRPTGAVRQLKDAAVSAVRAVRLMPEGAVEFQRKRMSIDAVAPSGPAWTRITVGL